MLKSDCKVYYVYEFGGEFEDKWEHGLGVCSTLELAKELQKQSKDFHATFKTPPIQYDTFMDMVDAVREYEIENDVYFGEDYIDQMVKMFPQYSKEELELTDRLMYEYNDYIDTNIIELNYYN